MPKAYKHTKAGRISSYYVLCYGRRPKSSTVQDLNKCNLMRTLIVQVALLSI